MFKNTNTPKYREILQYRTYKLCHSHIYMSQYDIRLKKCKPSSIAKGWWGGGPPQVTVGEGSHNGTPGSPAIFFSWASSYETVETLSTCIPAAAHWCPMSVQSIHSSPKIALNSNLRLRDVDIVTFCFWVTRPTFGPLCAFVSTGLHGSSYSSSSSGTSLTLDSFWHRCFSGIVWKKFLKNETYKKLPVIFNHEPFETVHCPLKTRLRGKQISTMWLTSLRRWKQEGIHSRIIIWMVYPFVYCSVLSTSFRCRA